MLLSLVNSNQWQNLLDLYRNNPVDLEWLCICNNNGEPGIPTLVTLLMDDKLYNYEVIKFKFPNNVQKTMTRVDFELTKVTEGFLFVH